MLKKLYLIIKNNKATFILGSVSYTMAMLLLLLRRFGSDPSYKTWEPFTSVFYEFTGILISNLFEILNFPLGGSLPFSLPILIFEWILIGGFAAIFVKYLVKQIINNCCLRKNIILKQTQKNPPNKTNHPTN